MSWVTSWRLSPVSGRGQRDAGGVDDQVVL
jgi:hypothetical protein